MASLHGQQAQEAGDVLEESFPTPAGLRHLVAIWCGDLDRFSGTHSIVW